VCDFLSDIIGDLFVGSLPDVWPFHRRPKDLMPRLAAGRDISFPAAVFGTTSYCKGTNVVLVVTPSEFYCCIRTYYPHTRRDIPVERLTVGLTRPGTSADNRPWLPGWWVIECMDGDAKVLLACHQHDLRYLQHALSIPVDPVADRR
jgi:hypothetical protein